MIKSTKSDDRVKLAIQQMLFEHPFYANIILQLKVVPSTKISTFAVSVDTLSYNRKFADSLTMKTIKVILIHEVLHLVFKHHLRMKVYGGKTYSHTQWNIAGDLAINSLIYTMDGFPTKALVPGRDGYKDLPMKKSAEWYLNNLPEPPAQDEQDEGESQDSDSDGESDESQDDQQGEGKPDEGESDESQDGQGSGESDESADGDSDEEGEGKSSGTGDPAEPQDEGEGEPAEPEPEAGDPDDPFGDVYATEVTEEEMEEAKEEISEILARANESTKSQGGEVPQVMQEIVTELTQGPKLNWKIIMRQFMASTKTATLNWRTPSRRIQSGRLIFPSRHKRDMPKALFIADTSGSMGRKDIETCLAEVFEAKDVVGEVDLLQFDTSVRAVSALDMSTNPKDIRIVGGGGTRFKSVTRWLDTIGKKENYRAVFVLSDMYLEKKDWTEELKQVSQNVIWLSTTPNIEMKPGRTIYIGD